LPTKQPGKQKPTQNKKVGHAIATKMIDTTMIKKPLTPQQTVIHRAQVDVSAQRHSAMPLTAVRVPPNSGYP